MAEMNTNAGSDRHQGFACPKKLSTRVDLTPMVDLGFLLITFFIFTYHISKPKAMDLYMPTEKGDSSTIGESTSLTVLPGDRNEIYYYHGSLKEALSKGLFRVTNYSLREGIGNIIRAKQMALDRVQPGLRKDLMLIIKPSGDSKYENVINILDEVLINDVSRYAIVDISSEEKRAMAYKGNK